TLSSSEWRGRQSGRHRAVERAAFEMKRGRRPEPPPASTCRTCASGGHRAGIDGVGPPLDEAHAVDEPQRSQERASAGAQSRDDEPAMVTELLGRLLERTRAAEVDGGERSEVEDDGARSLCDG